MEADIRQAIMELFRRVDTKHREYVLQQLKSRRTNEERLSYLRGWFAVEP